MNDWTRLLCATTALASAAIAAPAFAAGIDQRATFEIAAGSLDEALIAYSRQADVQVISASIDLAGKRTRGVSGEREAREALALLLQDSGLSFVATGERTVTVRAAQDPQGGSADGGADGNAVEALVVTAQKREEAIQDVPIAISAFTQKALEEQKIEGGFDLLKAIPNVTFSKNNFSGYNFSIRGVGTKAVSATTDAGVAVAYNNTTLIHNRLFEQEYFDVERVEVLRGPQGTLYGRNATSGVINVITAKPRLSEFEGSVKLETGNYDARRAVGMVNVPIIDDMLAVRLAGAWTQRSGYDFNSTTGNAVNGRDLWSGRLTVGFEPIEQLRANLIWEHFEEDDNRSRTGKQLCHRDEGRTQFGTLNLANYSGFNAYNAANAVRAFFNQGCQPGNLYDEAAFGVPNGLSISFIQALAALRTWGINIGSLPPGHGLWPGSEGDTTASLMLPRDPYDGMTQSHDLREISSIRDPIYRAKADIYELNVDFDVIPSLTLSSQTAYNVDEVYSFQDYNRFNSSPAFVDTTLLRGGLNGTLPTNPYNNLAPGGIFCDPQIGCSDKIAGFDISQASSKQFSQELRLSSDFDGPVNFSVGANFTRFKTVVDYYVMFNLLTALAWHAPMYALGWTSPTNLVWTPDSCPGGKGYVGGPPVPSDDPQSSCAYVDPNPVESINGQGHNYFRSKNPYKLMSKAAFGEVYWNINDTLKLTAGLRYTDDEKTFIPVPSQTLLAPGVLLGGTVAIGYPEKPPIVQAWQEYTGRLGLDWKPELPFTDHTLLYAFYSRGYKGGGANPPQPGFATEAEQIAASGCFPFVCGLLYPTVKLFAVEYGPTFEPEFVDAYEIGAKNTLLDGAMTLNATAFYYDYEGYQVSQIRDRTAVNENFDAKIWGLELETLFSPTPGLKFNANLGYLDTEIADGETSIDLMNRTQSDPNYAVVKPFVTFPSNCVLPVHVIEQWNGNTGSTYPYDLCPGLKGGLGITSNPIVDPAFGNTPFDYANYPELNGGAGIRADLGGNELPNAPHLTMNVGAQYGRDILDSSWRVTLRGDAYWQSQSWARVYNAVNDKLHGWYNLNVSVRLVNEDLGIEGEFYVKNLLDKSPITDAFLNSDDTGLTTNVFVLDPRLIGVSVRKTF